MGPCPDDDAVLAYVAGDLGEGDAGALAEHIDGCRECRLRVAAAAGAASDGEESAPAKVGRFEVEGVAGRGAMGIVYRGRDPRLGRAVALKVIRPDALGPDAHGRLEREARALARVDHGHVVRVYEVGDTDGATFVAMEYVDGQTLDTWLQAAPRPRAEILARFVEAGEGLLAAHQAGLVHRDFKPSNVMIDAGGRTKVTDFGLVRDGGDERPGSAKPGGDLALTQTGTVLGTPAYMAPEQLDARAADARADQFSFCVALFEALAGHRPFEADDLRGLMTALQRGRPASPRRAIPRRIHKAILRGLAREPQDRFPSMRELLDELAAHRRARRIYAAVAAIAAAAAAVAVMAVWPQPGRAATPCDEAGPRWAAVWTDERRAHLRATVTADWPKEPAVGIAPALRQRWQGLGRLDASFAIDGVRRFGDKWRSLYRATCDDGASGRSATAGLRRACLTDALGRLESIIVAPPDARFTDALTEVTSHVDRCSTHLVEALELPDEEAFALVEQARQHLSSAAALRWQGDYARAGEQVDEAIALAERAGYGPALAEAWLERSQIARHADDPDTCIESAHRAIALGQPSAYHRVVRVATDNLAWQYYFGKTDIEQARRWLTAAEQLDSRVPPTDYERVLRTTLRAQLSWRAGDIDEAIEMMEEAYQRVVDQSLGRELAIRTIEGIVVLLYHRRSFDDVAPWLDTLERAHGAHPLAASIAANHRGRVASFLGDHDDAAAHFERAAGLAGDDVARAARLVAAAAAHSRAGRRGEAERLFAAAEVAGDGREPRARLTCARAHHLERGEEYEAAIAVRRDCIRLQEADAGPLAPVVILGLARLGYSYRALGNTELAVEYLGRALERFEQIEREDEVVKALRKDLARLRQK